MKDKPVRGDLTDKMLLQHIRDDMTKYDIAAQYGMRVPTIVNRIKALSKTKKCCRCGGPSDFKMKKEFWCRDCASPMELTPMEKFNIMTNRHSMLSHAQEDGFNKGDIKYLDQHNKKIRRKKNESRTRKNQKAV
jgi:hypothetical protein